MKQLFPISGSLILLVILCMSTPACKKSSPAPAPAPSSPGSNEVVMQNTAFTPATITVAVNTTVKWTNKDGMTHTVTSTSGLFDSGNIASGGTYSRQFTTAGTFPYKCTIHPGMNGTVVVQ